jgi:hypothetical protein
MTTEVVVEVPEFWDEDMIDFHRNESSWCASNILPDLEARPCICKDTTFDFVREATEEDDAEWGKTELKPS